MTKFNCIITIICHKHTVAIVIGNTTVRKHPTQQKRGERMHCVYETIATEESDAWGRPYVGYGVEAWQVAEGGSRKLLHRVPDVFPDRERAEGFVQMCNDEEVAPFHLLEIIDNVLAE